MKTKGLQIAFVIFLLTALGGCAAGGVSGTQQSGSMSDDGSAVTDAAGDIATSAGDTAVDAAKDNIRQEVRRGVNEAFKGIFNRQ